MIVQVGGGALIYPVRLKVRLLFFSLVGKVKYGVKLDTEKERERNRHQIRWLVEFVNIPQRLRQSREESNNP